MSSLLDSIFGPGSSNSEKQGDEKDGLFSSPQKDSSQTKRTTTTMTLSPITASSTKHPKKKHKSTDDYDCKEKKVLSKKKELKKRRRQAARPASREFTLSVTTEPESTVLAEEISSIVKFHGLAVVEGALRDKGGKHDEILENVAQQAVKVRTTICDKLSSLGLTWNESANNEETIRFWEVAVRCQGRMDVRYISPTVDPGQDDFSFWKEHTLLNDIVAKILYGGDAPECQPQLIYAGWIFSFPGSVNQPWHQDGMPLFPMGTESLPTYAINVFIPLEDATAESGPTEFVVHSHRMRDEDAMNVVQRSQGDSQERDGGNDIASPLLKLGDVLIYDYRICHRGTANLGNKVRSVLYLMYARPWFREHLNFGTERLLGPTNRANNRTESL